MFLDEAGGVVKVNTEEGAAHVIAGTISGTDLEGYVMKSISILMIIGVLLLLVACVGQEQIISTSASLVGTSSPTIPSPTGTPPPTPTSLPRNTPTLIPTPTAMPTSTEAPEPTPVPDTGDLTGIRTYGGERNDYVYDILLLADGGTLIGGQADNTGLSARISHGNARVIRTDAEGASSGRRTTAVTSMLFSTA